MSVFFYLCIFVLRRLKKFYNAGQTGHTHTVFYNFEDYTAKKQPKAEREIEVA
jgi:hypothetical protein